MAQIFGGERVDPVRNKPPLAATAVSTWIGRISNGVDWVLVFALLPLFIVGLITMKSLGGTTSGSTGGDYFFNHQLIWIAAGFVIFFIAASIDWRFLRNGWLLFTLYITGIVVLGAILFLVRRVHGAQSWIKLGLFSFEPAEVMKLVVILVLAKYFSRRHVEIQHLKHIIVSALYAGAPALLVFLQPDLGSALIFFGVWFGMILVSGVSKKHLLAVVIVGLTAFFIAWYMVLAPYQKARVLNFLYPTRDPRGTGYNALQSKIAVGSGGLLGRGIGYGTQSRLQFLPEHETDFIFAAFAEEWGFVGITALFLLYGLVFWRILKAAFSGQTNFEKLFGLGMVFFIFSHFIIHIGMNLGLLPVTGITLPFLSYGGSHTISLLLGLGILQGMRKYGYESGVSRRDEDLFLAI